MYAAYVLSRLILNGDHLIYFKCEINFGKHGKTRRHQLLAITGSIKLSRYSFLCGDACLISAPVSNLDM